MTVLFSEMRSLGRLGRHGTQSWREQARSRLFEPFLPWHENLKFKTSEMAVQELKSSAIEVILHSWSFQERRDFGGLGEAESPGLPPGPAPKGAGSPVGTWLCPYASCLGTRSRRRERINPLPLGCTITVQQKRRDGRPLPGTQPNPDSASSAAQTPKPWGPAVHPARLAARAPGPHFRAVRVAGASPALRLGKALEGPRELQSNRPGLRSLPVGLSQRNKSTVKILATLCPESLGLTRVPRIIRILS